MSDAGDTAALERMAEAGAEIVNCIRVLEKDGSNLVAEVLSGCEFIEYDHYPASDVYDRETRAQYYFHAHPQTRGAWNDYGHFHTFLRPDADDDNPPCHLVAISMSQAGRPIRLFTTNRWVTAETWHPAEEVIAMLDRFVVDLARPSWPLNRWLSAMFVLFRSDIEALVKQRDVAVTRWRKKHPDRDVFEDRGLEVTSGKDIDLDRRLAEIRGRLGLEDESTADEQLKPA